MTVAEGLTLYTIIAVIVAVVLIVLEMIWHAKHSLNPSKSTLRTCRKCGNVFLLPRQEVDTRCPNPECHGASTPFRMPYSGIHEALKDRAKRLKR